MKKNLIKILILLTLTFGFSACSQSRARNQIIEHFNIPPEQCVLVPGENYKWIVKDNEGNIYYIDRKGAWGGTSQSAKEFTSVDTNLIFSNPQAKNETKKEQKE